MQKPYRFVLDRVASYADEAGAYLRRRRLRSQPFVRVWRPGGTIEALEPGGPADAAVSAAADELITLAGSED
jgi:hypothetical protein